MFLAQRIEYLGLEYMNFAGALALGAVIGTVVFVLLAAALRYSAILFMRSDQRHVRLDL